MDKQTNAACIFLKPVTWSVRSHGFARLTCLQKLRPGSTLVLAGSVPVDYLMRTAREATRHWRSGSSAG
jgi:hypothetical protein